MRSWLCVGLLLSVLVAAGCLQQGASATASPSPIPTESASPTLSASERPAPVTESELVVYTYDGMTADWGLGPKIFPEFEKACGCTVKTVAPGDVGAVLAKAISEKAHPQADVVLGVDNTFEAKAAEQDLFAPYVPGSIAFVGDLYSGDGRFIPFDWGYVAFVYDSTRISNPPESLDDLLKPEYRKQFVLEDARTSSTGKVFLEWVAAEKGNGTASYLRALKDQALTVAPGWSEAYNLFTAGEVPMVLSYSTSPAYHIVNENTTKYKAALFARLPRQVEFVSVVKGAPHPDLARRFVDFMLSPGAQREIPLGNFMYPSVAGTPLPEAFGGPLNVTAVSLPSDEEKWSAVWQGVFS